MNKHLRAGLAALAAPAALLLAVATPAAPASASPSHAAASRVDRLRCGASMTSYHPRDYTSTGVKVRTVGFARIRTVAHYRTTSHVKRRTASAQGRRTVWYYISGATPGYKVVVDVYVSRGGRTGSCSTWFRPRR